MVQKRIRITTAIVTAACLFSACAQKAAHQPVCIEKLKHILN